MEAQPTFETFDPFTPKRTYTYTPHAEDAKLLAIDSEAQQKTLSHDSFIADASAPPSSQSPPPHQHPTPAQVNGNTRATYREIPTQTSKATRMDYTCPRIMACFWYSNLPKTAKLGDVSTGHRV